jgi:hypothetical protein
VGLNVLAGYCYEHMTSDCALMNTGQYTLGKTCGSV